MAVSGVSGRLWSWGGGALHTVRWGDETVAFHEATASTHLFDEDTYRLVDALRRIDAAVTGADLWSAAFGDAPSDADCLALDATLQTLLQAGLVAAPDN